MEGKFKLIKKNFTQIDRREQIERKRDIAVEKFEKELNKTYEEGKKILSKKAWVEDHYNKTFIKEVQANEEWFKENLEKQAQLPLYEVIEIFLIFLIFLANWFHWRIYWI